MSFKNTIRSLLKDKLFSLLNITGLALGLSCILVIIYIIHDDLSYDHFHTKGKNIYRLLAADTYKADPNINSANTPFPYGPVLKDNFPAVEEFARFRNAYRAVVSIGDKTYKEPDFYYVDPAVLSMFDFKLKSGARSALDEPNTVLLTHETALRLFGSVDVVGKVIGYNGSGGERQLKITGVLEDLPSNTHFKFDYLASMKSLDLRQTLWTQWPSLWTYILLKENQNTAVLSAQFTNYLSSHVPENEKLEEGRFIYSRLEPLFDIQLHSRLDLQMKPTSDINFVYSIGGIALLIFGMICFNFISLSTARALKKVKEVSIRKIVGARRTQLVLLFLKESLVLSLTGIFIALMILETFSKEIATLSGRRFNPEINGDILIVLSTVVVTVTLAAGLYPAFFLSSLNADGLLRTARVRITAGGAALRKSLVVFQFAIASLMIFGSLLIREQVSFIRNKNLGAEISQMVYVPAIANSDAFLNELKTHESILAVTNSSRMPANEDSFDQRPIIAEGSDKIRDMESFAIDENFLDAFHIQLASGANLIRRTDTVNAKFLINEEAVRYLGWSSPEEAIGKRIGWQNNYVQGTVTGVTRDFHLGSLHSKIGPLVMLYPPSPGYFEFTSIKLKADDQLPETLALIEKLWKKYEPAGGFDLRFANDSFLRLHNADVKLGTLSNMFAFIAIVIAVLGLLGLTSYIVEEKTKELAIRKVLGATLGNLLKLLYGNFMKPVFFGAVATAPLMVWLAEKWLGGFSYHVAVDWKFYAVAIFGAVLLAGLTVSFKSVRAAFENPVKSLRND